LRGASQHPSAAGEQRSGKEAHQPLRLIGAERREAEGPAIKIIAASLATLVLRGPFLLGVFAAHKTLIGQENELV